MIGYVGAAVARGRAPLVVSFCGDDLLGTPNPGIHWRIRESLAKRLSFYAARRADRIIVKSDNLAEALPLGVEWKASVTPNGVPLGDFRLIDRRATRNELGWTGKRVVLFNVSSAGNSNVKNPRLARAAVQLAGREIDDLLFDEMASCSSQEVVKRMNAADCLLVTSLHEGSPNIVKEAMACNLPVVSVDCGDVRRRLASTYPSHVCGYDTDELALSLVDVLHASRRSNGREQLKSQGLDDDTVARRIVAVYEQALGNRSVRAA
jgi:glycosyltransferase involved in cell wall biosynthesis